MGGFQTDHLVEWQDEMLVMALSIVTETPPHDEEAFSCVCHKLGPSIFMLYKPKSTDQLIQLQQTEKISSGCIIGANYHLVTFHSQKKPNGGWWLLPELP